MTFETAMKQEIEKSAGAAQRQAELRAAAQGLPADAQRAAGLHARADTQMRLEKMAVDPDAFARFVERLSRMDDVHGRTPPPPVMVIDMTCCHAVDFVVVDISSTKPLSEAVAEAMRCVVGNSERR